MTRPPSAALTPLRDALNMLLALAVPVAPRALPLDAARGQIVANAVMIPCDLPTARTALRDGFAVEAALLGGASPYAPVPLSRPPAWIEAGSALPQGIDAVLPAEGISGRDAVADVPVHDGTRGPGEELSEGELLLAAGSRIGPRHLLALAATGLRTVEVRLPRLRLIVTGPSDPDALSKSLAALVAERGGTAETLAVADEPEAIADAIRGGEADAVLVLGGTGFGRSDRSADGLERAGRRLAHGIALRPGETAGIGEACGRPVILVPGRPDAALAVSLTLVQPLLSVLTGAGSIPTAPSCLLRKITSSIGLSEVVYLRRMEGGVEPLGGDALPLKRLVEADGAVVVPPDCEGFPAGSQVEVVPL